MSPKELKQKRRYLVEHNKQWPKTMQIVPVTQWPDSRGLTNPPFEMWRSKFFVAQVFREKNGVLRISVNRTELENGGRWKDGITWDELQEIKNQVGYAHKMAVELFPEAAGVVNVANMRHLWVLPEPLPFAWRLPEPETQTP